MKDFLIEKGWKFGGVAFDNDIETYYYKIFETTTRCNCNDNKNGIQVVVSEFDMTKMNRPKVFEISIRAEKKDGFWINFKVYTLSEEDVKNHLDDQIDVLIKAWEISNQ